VTRAVSLLLASLACATQLHAQAPRRLPVIAGGMGVNLLVEADGTVKSWGSPGGEATYLGDGSDQGDRKLPAPVPGVRDIVDAAVGMGHALLLSRDGTVLAWGRNNNCELGVTDDRKRLTPIPVNGVRDAIQVAAGETFSAAVIADGTVRVWGSNGGGLLANGKSGYSAPCATSPVPVEGLTGVKKIAIGTSMLALKQDGTVWGWGPNENGELCDGTTERRNRPVQMKGIANAVDIDIDGNSVIVLADGTVWKCGVNNDAALANAPKGSKHATPFRIAGITTAVAVRTAGATMVRLKDGTLLGWGSGMFGSLGDGYIDRITPTPHAPTGLGPVLVHFYASNSGFAIRADGTVMAWGYYVGGPKEWALTPFPIFKVKLAD
jgi:alpha-tubulin suppressor-like RCC1 family protein